MNFDGDIAVAFILWQCGVITSERMVEAATQALVDGLDSPSLRELAGVRVDDAPYDAPDLCARALEELGLTPADEHEARKALARSIARRIIDGEVDEFQGAGRLWRVFMTAARYPEFAGTLIGLEDEWEGGWGRDRGELRREVRTVAREILDAWGDRSSMPHRTLSAARRWLQDEYDRWAGAYAVVYKSGGWRVDTESGPWRYSDAALALFPRYRIAEVLIAEVERLRPSDFATGDSILAAIESCIRAAEQTSIAAQPAAREEIATFRRWLATVDSASLSGALLPYRRTLNADEMHRRRAELSARWDIIDSWVPMTNQPVPEGTLILDSAIWNDPSAVAALRIALRDEGVTVVVSLNEIDRSFEIAVEAFEPGYGSFGEVLATSRFPWFVIYTSHEGTTAMSKGPHLESFRRLVPNLDRWLWRGWGTTG